MSVGIDELTRTPNALAGHYSRFRVADRLLLTGHSHQAWPDVAVHGQLQAFDDAARDVDAKWAKASVQADAVAAGIRTLLGDPDGEIALGVNTHELLVRLLSALDLRRRPKLVTTDGEFHSARRQLARLSEAGVDVAVVAADPVDGLSERLAAAVDDRTAAVLVSSVLFSTARIVPGLADVAAACGRRGAELIVDAYHGVGILPMRLADDGLGDAWVLGGGYKYLQMGEGNCYLRLPPHADRFRPVITGWYAEFGSLSDTGGAVTYADGAALFAGATYDPTSHYRGARVLEFRDAHGLTPAFCRSLSQHQIRLLATEFDALDAPPSVVDRDRDTPFDAVGGFLALRCSDPASIHSGLSDRGVRCDFRGPYLRLGPAPYLSDRQLRDAIAALGDVVADRR